MYQACMLSQSCAYGHSKAALACKPCLYFWVACLLIEACSLCVSGCTHKMRTLHCQGWIAKPECCLHQDTLLLRMCVAAADVS